ncbi:hypothetical protein L2Y96_07820 [Luteibacter aegosomaticola]|jgi:hypothetical protein|uniref:hypothetical protein n=1 Tax=Luteibacter aegosomaticola TaxID=2911538 RepID=UPI001FF9F3F4|nr:hypothetical protein [Luteibacter aegosomaticola]UPG91662.1 hypothetical protein L2Y96_07820 [Luteibacter aegosomaticola]
MDDRTYLLGKLAALESALEAAISAHPEPGVLTLALCQAMARQAPAAQALDVGAYAEGWLAVVTPLLISRVKMRPSTPSMPTTARHH